ncbi:MAG: type 3-dehydroquinate dehydratase [Pseudomonadota bacterium]|jgi:3-dehydroquinate dehydratase-2
MNNTNNNIINNTNNNIIYILNGPNLNMLGKREPHIYGTDTLEDIKKICEDTAQQYNLEVVFYQSNREYELIDWIHQARETARGIVINPAAFTHTSIAILDALILCEFPIIEVHISNVYKREAFRHHSYVSSVASGVIAGLGTQGYGLAIQRLAHLLSI